MNIPTLYNVLEATPMQPNQDQKVLIGPKGFYIEVILYLPPENRLSFLIIWKVDLFICTDYTLSHFPTIYVNSIAQSHSTTLNHIGFILIG